MNSTQIRCFLTAAECQSFSEASDKLFMTPPTFSRSISALEKELGYPLFHREWKNLKLTPAGEIMYRGLLSMCDQFSELERQVQQVIRGDSGALSFGMLDAQMTDDLLQKLMRSFRTAHPGIDLKFSRHTFREMSDALSSGTLDIGITLSEDIAARDSLASRPLYQLQNYLVVPRTHPLAGKTGLHLADFAGETFVDIQAAESSVVSYQLLSACESAGFRPDRVVCPTIKEQTLCVESGIGITAFNENHQACHNPSLCAIAIPELPRVQFCLAWHKGNPNPAIPLFLAQVDALLP